MDLRIQINGKGNTAGILYFLKEKLGRAGTQLFAGDTDGGEAVHGGIYRRKAVKAAYQNILGNPEPQLRQTVDKNLCQYIIGTKKELGQAVRELSRAMEHGDE